jgi:hypothetical protein
MVKKVPSQQPAPAENVKVCQICRFDPETCGRDPDIKDRKWLRESVVWCCQWQPRLKDLDFSKMTEGAALYAIGVRVAEKDGKVGLNLPMPGKPGQQLFIPASDEKPGAIVASGHKKDRLKGARKTRCADCRHKVYISPSSQEMLRQYPETPVICLTCCMKRVEKESKKQKEALS